MAQFPVQIPPSYHAYVKSSSKGHVIISQIIDPSDPGGQYVLKCNTCGAYYKWSQIDYINPLGISLDQIEKFCTIHAHTKWEPTVANPYGSDMPGEPQQPVAEAWAGNPYPAQAINPYSEYTKTYTLPPLTIGPDTIPAVLAIAPYPDWNPDDWKPKDPFGLPQKGWAVPSTVPSTPVYTPNNEPLSEQEKLKLNTILEQLKKQQDEQDAKLAAEKQKYAEWAKQWGEDKYQSGFAIHQGGYRAETVVLPPEQLKKIWQWSRFKVDIQTKVNNGYVNEVRLFCNECSQFQRIEWSQLRVPTHDIWTGVEDWCRTHGDCGEPVWEGKKGRKFKDAN